MDLQLDGRVAVVTGATAGIGRGIASALAREGCKTMLVARRAELLRDVCSELEDEFGGEHLGLSIDLSTPGFEDEIASAVRSRFGRADIVVNNAGGSRPLTIRSSDALWQEAFAVNFEAARKLSHALLPAMIEARWGRIVCITGSLEPPILNGANVAKAGLHAWAKGLSREVAAHGVTINCLMPGRIHSEQIDMKMHPTARSRDEFIAANIPAGRFGQPAEIADAVAFFCSPRAGYITGQRLYVDGGMHRAL
jgi:3-oxoacyl-[acyl-carrier protein] reductase